MKKIIRKLTALVLSLLMLAGAVMPIVAKEDSTSFADVKSTHWFYKAVSYVVDKGLMVGMGESSFKPNVKFTRAMTVQVLSQLSGDDLSGYATTDFPDVPDKAWFKSAVAWAVDKGIVAGIDGKFKPNDYVTREQLARMIHQFAQKYGIENRFPAGNEGADSFADAKKIGAWAKEDMDWAVDNGIITGMGNNSLSPKGTATRAQAAQLFYSLHYMKNEGILPPDTTDFDAITVKESDAIQIFCWGDSMTAGGYPEKMREYGWSMNDEYTSTTFKVYNYGAGGDTAEHVAMKQGAIPMYVAPFTIPADKTPVRVYFYDDNFELVESLAHLGTKGLSPVTIAGQKGQISYKKVDGEEFYYFTRQGSGKFEEVKVTRLTRVVTNGMVIPDEDDFHVIFSGPSNNYTYDEAHKLIATQQKMIDYIGTDNYLIISLTCLEYLPGLPEFNADLEAYYGEHFLDFRTYAITQGLEDAAAQGLIDLDARTPEEKQKDDENIAKGEIPASMLSDAEHGNFIYNTLLGQQVFKRLVELGYLETDK